MSLHTFETIVEVNEDRRLVVQLPGDVPVGKHRLVAVIGEAPAAGGAEEPSWKFPILVGTQWPEGLTWRREDLYAD